MSTAPVLDERLHIDVFKAAVDAALGSKARCYEYSEVPGSAQNFVESERRKPLPNIFVLISLERTYVPPRRLIGRAGRSGWRLTFRALGRSEREARWAAARIADAVDEVRFDIEGFRTDPVTHESSTQPNWDDKRWVIDKFYTYIL